MSVHPITIKLATQERAAPLPLKPDATDQQLTLHASLERFPKANDIEVAVRRGLQHLTILDPIDLRGEPALGTIRLLRDLTACHVSVRWSCRSLDFSVASLCHLQPPVAGPGASRTDWLAAFRFGLFYWRRGPEFVSVRDSRAARVCFFLLDDEPTVQAFRECQLVTSRAGLVHRYGNRVLADLEESGLVITSGEFSVSSPYRMKHWPVPSQAV